MHPSPESPDREARLRQAVAEAQEGLELEFPAAHENRMIGIAFLPAAHSSVDIDETGEPAPFTDDDRESISNLITAWHTVSPEDVEATWQQYATSPYYVVDGTGLRQVTAASIERWQEAQGTADTQGFVPQKPRQVTISTLQVVHIASRIASATFQAREEGENGYVWMGNGAAHFVKGGSEGYGGWRLLVVAKGGDVSPPG